MNTKAEELSQLTIKDVAHATAKATLGSIPTIGSGMSEFFGLVIAPPIEKRRLEWMIDVETRLKELEAEGKIDFEQLKNNDQFIDIVLQAYTLAVKTSNEAKLVALKNVVLKTALSKDPDEIISQIFMNLIDSFTELHIKLLVLFDDVKTFYESKNIELPNLVVGNLRTIITTAFPEFKDKKELLHLVWEELRRAGLHDNAELGTMISREGVMTARINELGKKFLEYIKEN